MFTAQLTGREPPGRQQTQRHAGFPSRHSSLHTPYRRLSKGLQATPSALHGSVVGTLGPSRIGDPYHFDQTAVENLRNDGACAGVDSGRKSRTSPALELRNKLCHAPVT